ncbi:DUF6090 family protein [Aegicerativicinus sediminis]
MISFLRKLRHSFISQNRFSKYLLYALGEIFLVVIGILIALQINNWNEDQKKGTYEQKILTAIKTDLKSSREEVLKAIDDDGRWRDCIHKILRYLDQRKPYEKQLDQCFGSYYWSSTVQFSTSSYEELKNRGVELISNPELRSKLTDMYDFKLDVLRSEIEVWDSQLLSSTIYPIHTDLFRKYYPESWSLYEDEFASPIDYEKLMDNEKFKNVLAEIISLRNYSIAANELLEKDIQKLIVDIEKELEELKK